MAYRKMRDPAYPFLQDGIAGRLLPFLDHEAGVDQSLNHDLGRLFRVRDLTWKILAVEQISQNILWGELAHEP
jgi:hypothetical protein